MHIFYEFDMDFHSNHMPVKITFLYIVYFKNKFYFRAVSVVYYLSSQHARYDVIVSCVTLEIKIIQHICN